MFYAHKVPIWLGQRLDEPERFGFLSMLPSPPLRITCLENGATEDRHICLLLYLNLQVFAWKKAWALRSLFFG